MIMLCLDSEGLITQALLTANFEAAVDVCLHSNRNAEAVMLAMAGGSELFKRTQARVLEKQQDALSRVLKIHLLQEYSCLNSCFFVCVSSSF